MSMMTDETSNLPDHMMWYVLRGSDPTTIFSDKTKVLYGYSKLPQMFFFSGINPKKPEGMKGTIIKKRGEIGISQSIRNRDFAGFLGGRVREYRLHMSKMSDKQRQKIGERVLSNPERAVNSKSFEAYLAEQEFKRKRDRQ